MIVIETLAQRPDQNRFTVGRTTVRSRYHNGTGATYRRDAVVASKRIGHDRGIAILFHRHELSIDSTRIFTGPSPLRNHQSAVILSSEASRFHLALGKQ